MIDRDERGAFRYTSPHERYRKAGDRILGFFDDIRNKDQPDAHLVDPGVEAAVREWAADDDNATVVIVYERLRRGHLGMLEAGIPIAGLDKTVTDIEARLANLDAALPPGTMPHSKPDPVLRGASL